MHATRTRTPAIGGRRADLRSNRLRRIELLDRLEEQRALDELLGSVSTGSSGALVLRGEPGIGKTALLGYARAAAPGMHHVVAAGFESETGLAYAGIERAIRPLVGRGESLPAPQRNALHAALGLAEGSAPDPFLVGLATLSLLASLAADRPVLWVVDDAQWLDRESARVVGFVARRLQHESVAVLVASRPTEAGADPFAGVASMPIGGLSDDAALRLVDALLPGRLLDVATRRRLVVETGANPLALREIAADLRSRSPVSAGLQLAPFPIGSRLEEHFLTSVRRLPEDTQTFVLVAAVEAGRDAGCSWDAAAVLGLAGAATDRAFAERLLLPGAAVTFRHPLIRSAIYNGASDDDRRRVHAALASVTDRLREPVRHAWHRSEATVGPDESVATALEDAAADARRRGGWSTATELLRRAAALSVDRSRRSALLLDAAEAAVTAGLLDDADRLLQLVDPVDADERIAARAVHVRGAVLRETRPGDAVPMLLQAATAYEGIDSPSVRRALLEAVEAELMARPAEPRSDAAELLALARRHPADPTEATPADRLLDAFTVRAADGYVAAVPLLSAAVRAITADDAFAEEAPRWVLLGGAAAGDVWDLERRLAMLDRLVEVSRARGALPSLRAALLALSDAELRAGRYAAADGHLEEAIDVTAALGFDISDPSAFTLLMSAWRGRSDEARSAAAVMEDIAAITGVGTLRNLARQAVGLVELSDGRYEAALSALRPIFEDDPPSQANTVLPDIVEAAVRCGDDRMAATALARLDERATAAGTPWAIGVLTRSMALTAPAHEADALFEQALAHLSASPARPDVARTRLLHGEWLRRQRRQRDARAQLRSALDLFIDIGALGFAERANRELSATGERARRRTVETTFELTPQETQIARRAAAGSTNVEIAAELFLSSSTVDYHLRKVYRKLGITSRVQLHNVLPS